MSLLQIVLLFTIAGLLQSLFGGAPIHHTSYIEQSLIDEQKADAQRQIDLKNAKCVGESHAEIVSIGIKSYYPYIKDSQIRCIPNSVDHRFYEDRFEYGCIWNETKELVSWYKDGIIPHADKVTNAMVCQHIFADGAEINQYGFYQTDEHWQYKKSECVDRTLDIKGVCYEMYVEDSLPEPKKCDVQFMWWNETSSTCQHYVWSGKTLNFTTNIESDVNDGSES